MLDRERRAEKVLPQKKACTSWEKSRQIKKKYM